MVVRIKSEAPEKERIMLEAIENNCLESVTTVQEDLDLIFQGLKLGATEKCGTFQ